MLTPIDIENKEFTKAFRGYDIYEVEEFMKNLVADYEKLYRENAELKEKNAMLGDTIGNYKGMEETMQNAILVAQRTAEDIKQNAYERAETIVKDAQRRAAEAINNANRSIRDLEKNYLSLQSDMSGFRAKMNSLLSTYMQLLSDLPEQKEQKGALFNQVQAGLEQEEPLVRSSDHNEPENNYENTNTFTLPSLIREPEASSSAPERDAKPVAEDNAEKKVAPAIPLRQTTGLDPERKINPVVEELLRKKREQSGLSAEPYTEAKEAEAEESEQEMTPVFVEAPANEEEPVAEPALADENEPFIIKKETLEREIPKQENEAGMPVFNLDNLKDFDVFHDDSL